MKQTRKYFILLYVLLTVFGVSCSKEFEEHYNPRASVDKNIIEVLEEDPELTDFVKIIDKLGLRKALGEAAIYTCLAPTNEHVQVFVEANGFTTIDQVPEPLLRQYVNGHFINGMYYKYDIEKRYRDAATGGLAPTKATYYTTRGEGNLKAKSIRIFTQPFFTAQADDYKTVYNIVGSGFTVESAKVHETKYDISAINGVIHVLTSPLPNLPVTGSAAALDSGISLFSEWLEGHESYVLGPKDEFGWVDTTLIKIYSGVRNVADEAVLSTVFAPTDEAMLEYFAPYAQHFGGTPGTLDSVPEFVRTQVVKTALLAEPWFKSDVVRDMPKIRVGGFPQEVSKIAPTIVGSVLSSNSIIYKVNKVIESPILHSVEGGIYMREKFNLQWVQMLKLTSGLADGLTDGLYYQHADKTILLQPDIHWTGAPVEDLSPDDREIRRQECRTGIFNIDVRDDGGFRKRYYPTEFGWILFDNNRFIDYTGNSVSLLSRNPVWEKSNGAIFEIDGFLKPLDPADLTRTVFALIAADSQYSQFKNAIIKAGLETELNLTGFFTYTIFVPTNTAMQTAGINVATSTPEQMRNFVGKYIIPNRYVFTDGVTQGGLIPNKNGEMVSFSGAWETFSVTYSQKTIKPTPLTAANVQGSNGVIHKVNETF